MKTLNAIAYILEFEQWAFVHKQRIAWEDIWSISLSFLQEVTSSYPGWIKSPHVVTLGILKLPGGGGGIPE